MEELSEPTVAMLVTTSIFFGVMIITLLQNQFFKPKPYVRRRLVLYDGPEAQAQLARDIIRYRMCPFHMSDADVAELFRRTGINPRTP